MIKGLLHKVKDQIKVEIQIDEDKFEIKTITYVMGEAVSNVVVDMTPMYEVFKKRLIKDIKYKVKD